MSPRRAAEKIMRHSRVMGFACWRKWSGLSRTQYVFVAVLDNAIKIRIADHDLPPRWRGARWPDSMDVRPKDWPSAVEFLTTHCRE